MITATWRVERLETGDEDYQAQCIAPLLWAMAAGAACVTFADKI